MNDWLQLFSQGEAGAEGGAGEAPEAGAAEQSPAAEHWQRVEALYDGLMQQAESLREVFPDFDIRRELQNPDFALALRCGLGIEGAYFSTHAAEILPAAMAYGAQYAREQLAASLMGGSRPGENGLSGSGAVKMGSSVASLSRGEYDKICRMVEKGERVSFG